MGSAGPGGTARGVVPDVSAELAAYAAGLRAVAGVDEVGRGSWAGPLVAAAVILPDPRRGLPEELIGVRDSKLLPAARRVELHGRIVAAARAVGVGFVSAEELDLLGLGAAGELAMIRAVRALGTAPDHLLVDAFRLPACAVPQTPIVRGDARCYSIAAASIVAKVVRDRAMCDLDQQYPEYGLAKHKGYGAPSHRAALARLGPSPIHRRSYGPVAALGAVL